MEAANKDPQTLHAMCPRCGSTFVSALRVDRQTFETFTVTGPVVERCPSCGRATRYERRDYFFPADVADDR